MVSPSMGDASAIQRKPSGHIHINPPILCGVCDHSKNGYDEVTAEAKHTIPAQSNCMMMFEGDYLSVEGGNEKPLHTALDKCALLCPTFCSASFASSFMTHIVNFTT